jgi:hypothetical protein
MISQLIGFKLPTEVGGNVGNKLDKLGTFNGAVVAGVDLLAE